MGIFDLLPSSGSSGNGISMNNTGLGFTNNTGSSLGGLTVPNNISDYLYKSKFESPLSNLANLGNANKTGGFFGNGLDLGMNLDTAKFGFGALSSIMQLFGANEARKSIKAQTEFARRNLENSELAYNDRVAFRGRMTEASKNNSTADSIANAESNSVGRYGTGGLLAKGGLRSRDETPAA